MVFFARGFYIMQRRLSDDALSSSQDYDDHMTKVWHGKHTTHGPAYPHFYLTFTLSQCLPSSTWQLRTKYKIMYGGSADTAFRCVAMARPLARTRECPRMNLHTILGAIERARAAAYDGRMHVPHTRMSMCACGGGAGAQA